jgi:hypothetical protein
MNIIEENKVKLENVIKNQLLLESNIGKMVRICYINNLLNPELSEIYGELFSIHRFDRVVIKTEDSFHYIEFAGINNSILFIEEENDIRIFENTNLETQIPNHPLLIERIRTFLFGSVITDAERRYRENTKFRFTQNPTGMDGWKELEKYIDDEYKEIWKSSWGEINLMRKHPNY